MQQVGLTQTPSKALGKRVTVTDGTEFPLTGMCIYFVRPSNTKPISTSNIADVSAVCTSPCKIYTVSIGGSEWSG